MRLLLAAIIGLSAFVGARAWMQSAPGIACFSVAGTRKDNKAVLVFDACRGTIRAVILPKTLHDHEKPIPTPDTESKTEL